MFYMCIALMGILREERAYGRYPFQSYHACSSFLPRKNAGFYSVLSMWPRTRHSIKTLNPYLFMGVPFLSKVGFFWLLFVKFPSQNF